MDVDNAITNLESVPKKLDILIYIIREFKMEWYLSGN